MNVKEVRHGAMYRCLTPPATYVRHTCLNNSPLPLSFVVEPGKECPTIEKIYCPPLDRLGHPSVPVPRLPGGGCGRLPMPTPKPTTQYGGWGREPAARVAPVCTQPACDPESHGRMHARTYKHAHAHTHMHTIYLCSSLPCVCCSHPVRIPCFCRNKNGAS
jgi:hypothetical protein